MDSPRSLLAPVTMATLPRMLSRTLVMGVSFRSALKKCVAGSWKIRAFPVNETLATSEFLHSGNTCFFLVPEGAHMSNRLEALRVFCTAADAANFRDAAVRAVGVAAGGHARGARARRRNWASCCSTAAPAACSSPISASSSRSARAPRWAASMRCSTAPTGARCRSMRARCG